MSESHEAVPSRRMRLDLNPDEIRELHDLAAFVCQRAPGQNEALERAMWKLREAGIVALGPRPVAPPLVTAREREEAERAAERREAG